MSAFMRIVWLYIMGWKIADALATHVGCGYFDVPEANPTLKTLAQWAGGYWVAWPYLLGWGGVLVFLCWTFERRERFSWVGFGLAWPLGILSCMGPLSHAIWWSI